jgi:predicted NBD/HSP70 family sugar kinase
MLVRLFRRRQMNREAPYMPRIDLASAQLSSSETARDMNRDVVLELVRVHQPLSRADLARLSGLQRSTVSLICEQLMEEGWVVEGATTRLPRGRHPTMLMLNEQIALLVADVHPLEATVAVVDLNGRFLVRSVVPMLADGVASVHRIGEEMERLRTRHADKSFEGVGITMPGRVASSTQKLIFAPNLRWPDIPVKELLEERLGLTVELENGANAALLAELWAGHLHGVRNAVLITISEGIGGAILANGRLVSGGNGMAGEFGHIPLSDAGPRCACGLMGCWEVFASTTAAVRFYHELSGDGVGVDFDGLLKRADDGDAHAIGAIDKQARNIGLGMRAILAAVSPEVIVITGLVASAWSRYEHPLREAIERLVLGNVPMPRLMPLVEGEATWLRGAAALVLQRHTGYHSSRHTDLR